MFIGVYNLANFVTLLGLASAVVACFSAGNNLLLAVCMFLLSGLCDMFDGRIARGAGSRTRKEKLFGIQIDTVCDMVSFGIAPIVIAYHCGFNHWYDMAIYIVYAACAAIRLAYFNTQAIEETPDLNMKAFTGVPVPFSCMVLPPLMILHALVDSRVAVNVIFDIVYLAVGIAFIINVKIKKLNIPQSIALIAFEAVCVVSMFLAFKK
ncbi:MAG: CDP-alcohol phosphatidyltransferase family protein [Clostridia bacterium]|nr:CDP-alcohol phosphatidyltransferase family protein [Clostridia bacterium]MBQ7048650.1 CDP-alcohol phosphatidyltransferase family protein [Clostridia bacterium]